MDQIGIVIFGVLAVFLSQDRRESYRKWAPIFGMLGQPFWFYAAITADQPGVVFVCVLYTLSWMRGILNYWIRPQAPRTNKPTGPNFRLSYRWMDKYKSHKTVFAERIEFIREIEGVTKYQLLLINAQGLRDFIDVSREYFVRHQPQVGGFYVRYADGHESFSPERPFVDGYTLLPA
jgi:hypothetical protein